MFEQKNQLSYLPCSPINMFLGKFVAYCSKIERIAKILKSHLKTCSSLLLNKRNNIPTL